MYIVKLNNHLMNNHLNMLPKQAKFDLKSSKMCARSHYRELTTLPKTHNREGQTPPIINSWLRYCEKKILSIEVYFADTISLLYTLMYINITRFGYIQ